MPKNTISPTKSLHRAPLRGTLLASLVILGLLLSGLPRPAQAQDGDEAAGAARFVVVINADNPAESHDSGRVSKMFLKKIKRWPDGVAVRPVDQSEKSSIREPFTEAIHSKGVSAIKSFWQRMIFSGRDVPPAELANDEAVLDFVRAYPGAIGYVSADTDLGEGVKVLTITE